MPEKSNKNVDASSVFDYSRYHYDFSDKWYTLIDMPIEDFTLPLLPKILGKLLEKFVIVDDIYAPLALIYTLCPSAIARKLPILVLVGQSGTGKSTLAKVIAKMRGVEPLSSASTFAAIRNVLTNTRYKGDTKRFSDDESFEANTILVWEDIDIRVLEEKPDIYRMLKTGYDRATHIINISSQKPGENIRFETFCGKVLSTIQPLWAFPKYSELERRIVLIPFRKHEQLPREIEDIDLYNFAELAFYYEAYWANEQRCELYVNTRKSLARRKPSDITALEWTILVDLLTTGIVCGIWQSTKDAIEWAKRYLKASNEIKANQSSPFLELLKDYIEQEEILHERLKKNLDSRLIISPEHLKETYTRWHRQGKIEISPMPQNVVEYMNRLGYSLTPKGWEKIHE